VLLNSLRNKLTAVIIRHYGNPSIFANSLFAVKILTIIYRENSRDAPSRASRRFSPSDSHTLRRCPIQYPPSLLHQISRILRYILYFLQTHASKSKISDVINVSGSAKTVKGEENSSQGYIHIFIRAHDVICYHPRNISFANMEVWLFIVTLYSLFLVYCTYVLSQYGSIYSLVNYCVLKMLVFLSTWIWRKWSLWNSINISYWQQF
jgi:hypothetical protein